MADVPVAEPADVGTIGFVGLGNMGLPMARRLVSAGYTVRGYDVLDDARSRAAEADIPVVSTLGDVASSDVVILMLPSSAVVQRVLDEPDFTSSLAAGSLLVDMGSSNPAATRSVSAQVAGLGISMLDAPVSGGVGGAETGRLTIMVGGSEEDLARAQPWLTCLGRPVHVGAIGSGDALKALNNLLSATHLWVTSEAMIVGQRFGIDPHVMLDVFNGSSGRSGSTENKWPNFIISGGFDSGFGLQLMLKDMRIATGFARECGLPSRLGEAAVELWAEAATGLDESADHTEVARYLEEQADGTTPSGGDPR